MTSWTPAAGERECWADEGRSRGRERPLILSVLLAFVPFLPGDRPWPTEQAKAERQRFQVLAWEPVRSLSEVDKAVLRELKARFGEDDRIADRGEPFRATDVVDGNPARRLVVAGRAERRWFVCYEAGGIGHHLMLVVFDTDAASPTLAMLARGFAGQHDDAAGWKADISDLKKAIAAGRLSVDDPDIYLPRQKPK